jgi:hypothetical protein
MNIYEMYYNNDKKLNFFVKRDTWLHTIACVVLIEGINQGDDIPGKTPYFNNPKVTAIFWKEWSFKKCHKENISNISELICPGTFSYNFVCSFETYQKYAL